VAPADADFSVHTDTLGYTYAQPHAEEGEPPLDFHHLPVDGEAVLVGGPWQPVRLDGAQEWLPLLSGQEPSRDSLGTPAATLRKVGHGSVMGVHGPVFTSYYHTRYPRLGHLLSGLFRKLWKTPTVEVEAPGSVVHTLRRQGDRTIVHLLNRAADPPTSPHRVLVEQVPSVGPVVVRIRQPERPASVRLVPKAETTLRWDWSNGLLTVHLSQLHIHSALVVEVTKDR
jgi:hypothetical protein